MWYVSCICVTWNTSYLHDSFLPAMTHSCVTCLILYVTWLDDVCDMSLAYLWHVVRSISMTQSWLPWLIHMRHASFTYVTWLIDVCHHLKHCNILQHTATHCNTLQYTASECVAHMWQASFTCVTWLIQVCRNLTHCNILQHAATHYTWACPSYVTCSIRIRHLTLSGVP